MYIFTVIQLHIIVAPVTCVIVHLLDTSIVFPNLTIIARIAYARVLRVCQSYFNVCPYVR